MSISRINSTLTIAALVISLAIGAQNNLPATGNVLLDSNCTILGSLTVNGNIQSSGNITAACISSACLNVPGNTTIGKLVVRNSISTDSIIASRIMSSDSLIHFGDHSLVYNKNTINFYNDAYNIGQLGEMPCLGLSFGSNVSSCANQSIVLGSGISPNSFLSNGKNPNSLFVGFNSNVPTFVVSAANGNNGSFGNVGIGLLPTSNYLPYKMLTVNGDVSLANYNASGLGNPVDGLSGLEILGNNQVPTRRGISLDPDPNGDFDFYMNSGQNPSGFNFIDGNTSSPSIQNLFPTINTGIPVAAHAVLMTIQSNGKVGIGVSPAEMKGGYQLYVKGGILTEIVKVAIKGTADWSDYIFTEGYKLPSLMDVEKYINKNGHLPEIPSAQEVCKNGIDIAQMDSKLLGKIEELTLYVISMQKQVDELKKENEFLKKSINR